MDKSMTLPTKSRKLGWLKVLLAGFLFFLLSLAILIVTGNPNLFPTVVLIGNFLVPVAYVAFFYERRYLSRLSMPVTAYMFLYGGLLGVLASSILEPIFIRQMDILSVALIGLIEEGAKILGVILIATRFRHDSEMDGLILGAAAGMGFAALESMGYAFTAFIASQGSLSATVGTTLIRGIFAPLGHGTWTAILASVLFRESKANRFRINGKVIGAYLVVSLLHALWDALPPVVSSIFSAGYDVVIAQSMLGALGFILLGVRWREARRLQEAEEEKLHSAEMPNVETLV